MELFQASWLNIMLGVHYAKDDGELFHEYTRRLWLHAMGAVLCAKDNLDLCQRVWLNMIPEVRYAKVNRELLCPGIWFHAIKQ